MEEQHSWGRSAVFTEDRHDTAPRQAFVQKTFILRQTASFGKAQTWQVITQHSLQKSGGDQCLGCRGRSKFVENGHHRTGEIRTQRGEGHQTVGGVEALFQAE